MGCLPSWIVTLLLSLLLGAGLIGWDTTLRQPPEPCTVLAGRPDVPVRVGPGEGRAVRLFLPVGQDVPVIGRAVVDGGGWWQVALAGVAQAWVSAGDVTAAGACDGVPDVAAPPVIPAAPQGGSQGTGGDSGGTAGSRAWGACGSCADCGADPSQCVLSPDGQCVWDAARCGGAGASPPSGGGSSCVPDGQSYCGHTGEFYDYCGSGELNPEWECRDSCGTLLYRGVDPAGCGGDD